MVQTIAGCRRAKAPRESLDDCGFQGQRRRYPPGLRPVRCALSHLGLFTEAVVAIRRQQVQGGEQPQRELHALEFAAAHGADRAERRSLANLREVVGHEPLGRIKGFGVCQYGERGSVGNAKLAIDVVQVHFHGSLGESKPLRYFLVG